MKAEMKLKDMNKKTKAALNMRITSEVSKLAKESASQIENLRLSSKKARSEMRRELLYAVRSAAAEAKKNLAAAVAVAKTQFTKANEAEQAAAKKNAAGRAAIARSIARSKAAAKRQLKDAVASMNRSFLALKVETAKKIKKSNHKVTAYADALAKEAKDVDALMKANTNALLAKIARSKASTSKAISAAGAKSAAVWNLGLKGVKLALKAARAHATNKFGKLYRDMSKERSRADTALSASVASVKDQETRLSGEIAVVSGEVARNKAIQLRVNRRSNAELSRITKLSNVRHSASIRARGKLRALLDENKRAASEEVKALNKLFVTKLN